eukprot:1161244-Pelagomonas_calceolata.AAC.12
MHAKALTYLHTSKAKNVTWPKVTTGHDILRMIGQHSTGKQSHYANALRLAFHLLVRMRMLACNHTRPCASSHAQPPQNLANAPMNKLFKKAHHRPWACSAPTCASGCSEFRSSRVTRPACRLPHTKGSSMSPGTQQASKQAYKQASKRGSKQASKRGSKYALLASCPTQRAAQCHLAKPTAIARGG